MSLNANIHRLMQEMCRPAPEAYLWWNALADLAMAVDHILDGDPFDPSQFREAICRWVLDVPANKFWDTNKVLLLPVMVNAFDAWMHSNTGPKIKSCDVYTETAATIAWIIGGRDHVQKHLPAIREAITELSKQDDQQDEPCQ